MGFILLFWLSHQEIRQSSIFSTIFLRLMGFLLLKKEKCPVKLMFCQATGEALTRPGVKEERFGVSTL